MGRFEVLGADSPILFNHRAFQTPAVSPGFLRVSWKEGSLERMESEGTPRRFSGFPDPSDTLFQRFSPARAPVLERGAGPRDVQRPGPASSSDFQKSEFTWACLFFMVVVGTQFTFLLYGGLVAEIPT